MKKKKNLHFVSDGAVFLHVVVIVTWSHLCLFNICSSL